MAEWYAVLPGDDYARVLEAWIDAPTENLETLGYILTVARDQVWTFAPESVDDDDEWVDPTDPLVDVPERLVYAQLQQAQNLWNAGRVTSAGEVGGDGYTYTPRPLDKTIRGIIRPIRGAFDVG